MPKTSSGEPDLTDASSLGDRVDHTGPTKTDPNKAGMITRRVRNAL